ncbi:MAG: hypothetical protein AB7U29_00890 [Desulfobulbus sp.]
MKALTSIIIATTVFLTLTAACSHEPMKGSGSMDGSMMTDKPMMEKPVDQM